MKPSGNVVTKRQHPRRPLTAIERKRFLFCAGCGKPIDARRGPSLPVRDGERGWHAGCWASAHPLPAARGRDRRGELYAEEP